MRLQAHLWISAIVTLLTLLGCLFGWMFMARLAKWLLALMGLQARSWNLFIAMLLVFVSISFLVLLAKWVLGPYSWGLFTALAFGLIELMIRLAKWLLRIAKELGL